MSGNQFIPKMRQVAEIEVGESVPVKEGKSSNVLLKIVQSIVVALFGLLPIFFIPGSWLLLGLNKLLVITIAGVLVVILLSLLSLQRVKVQTILPLTLGLFWMTAFAALASGVISGDVQDALRGSLFETQTFSFFVVMALAMTIPLVLQGAKKMTLRALTLFGASATLLSVYLILRLLLGSDFLPFNTFTAITVSPVGTFNDLAIFAGLQVLLGLVTLIQLPLKRSMQYVISLLILAALLILSVVNFFNIWVVVGFFSFLVLIYLLSRDTLFKKSEQTAVIDSRVLIVMAALVCVLSTTFIVAGDYVGSKVGQLVDVQYVEVRPSIEATIGIARAVYQEDFLFGIGANRFVDAWRLYKDPSINETMFWDTDFSAGSGFVPTVFITLGLLGGISLVAFHIGLLYIGYQMLLRGIGRDPYWYYLGTFSFTAACFIWIMSYIYVPGATILLLGALFTGLTFTAAAVLLPTSVRTVSLMINRQRGFLLMTLVILVVTTAVATFYAVGKQYIAEVQFMNAQATATDIKTFDQVVTTAHDRYPDDRFLRFKAQVHSETVTQLLGINDPTEEQQQTFLASAEAALLAAEQAVREDGSDPDNHAVLASVFSNLAIAGIAGAEIRAASSLQEAIRLDPKNPGYPLIAAQLAVRNGDIDEARAKISETLALKNNFTPAMYLSAQLDIGEGKTDSAIATTRSIITLEPRNPTRYFQLGVLLSATNALPEAIAAYRAAISLDPQYANARYLLALAHLNSGNAVEALVQLRVVQNTNPDNQQLLELIKQIETGTYVVQDNATLEAPIDESTSLDGTTSDSTIRPGDVESGLITPVNTISSASEPAAETPTVEVDTPLTNTESQTATTTGDTPTQ